MILFYALSYQPIQDLKYCLCPEMKDVLVSYHVLRMIKEPMKKLEPYLKIRSPFLDSGAFSAMTKKVTIDLDEYCDFIKKTEKCWKVYAALDVIGDPIATRKNVEYMESKGLKPLPTFHYGSPIEELERMLKKYSYIALGGLVPLALKRNTLRAWLDKCFSVIMKKEYWPVKVHGFGVNATWAWMRYPFYSTDATSWMSGRRFGDVITVNELKLKKASQRNDPTLFVKGKAANWRFRSEKNIVAYAEMADRATRLWQARGIDWEKIKLHNDVRHA